MHCVLPTFHHLMGAALHREQRTSVIMEALGTTGSAEPKLTKQTVSPPHPDNNAERQQAKRAVGIKTMLSPG